MPYIKKEDRKKFYPHLGNLADEIETDGDLNYCITKLLHLFIKKHGKNYANLARCIGSLKCVSMEFYRRVVAPYEDIKIKENGDIQ